MNAEWIDSSDACHYKNRFWKKHERFLTCEKALK